MTTDDLTAALRACAAGLYPLEARRRPARRQRDVPAP